MLYNRHQQHALQPKWLWYSFVGTCELVLPWVFPDTEAGQGEHLGLGEQELSQGSCQGIPTVMKYTAWTIFKPSGNGMEGNSQTSL